MNLNPTNTTETNPNDEIAQTLRSIDTIVFDLDNTMYDESDELRLAHSLGYTGLLYDRFQPISEHYATVEEFQTAFRDVVSPAEGKKRSLGEALAHLGFGVPEEIRDEAKNAGDKAKLELIMPNPELGETLMMLKKSGIDVMILTAAVADGTGDKLQRIFGENYHQIFAPEDIWTSENKERGKKKDGTVYPYLLEYVAAKYKGQKGTDYKSSVAMVSNSFDKDLATAAVYDGIDALVHIDVKRKEDPSIEDYGENGRQKLIKFRSINNLVDVFSN